MLRFAPFCFLWIFVCLPLHATGSSPITTSLNYSLQSGWNMVGVFASEGTTAGGFFHDFPLTSCAFTLQSTWAHYCPANITAPTSGSIPLTTPLQYGQGFFFQANAGTITKTLSFNPSKTLTLASGWNLISPASKTSPVWPSSVRIIADYRNGGYRASMPNSSLTHNKIPGSLNSFAYLDAIFIYSLASVELNQNLGTDLTSNPVISQKLCDTKAIQSESFDSSLDVRINAPENQDIFTVKWNPVTGAQTYTMTFTVQGFGSITFSSLEYNSNIFRRDDTAGGPSSFNLSYIGNEWKSQQILTGKNWKILVKAVSQNGSVISSAPEQSFTVGSPIPTPPLYTWAEAPSISGGNAEIQWCDVATATGYRVEYGTSPSSLTSTLSTTSLTLASLAVSNTTYARVRPLRNAVEGYASPVMTITPAANPDLSITGLSLNQGVTIDLTNADNPSTDSVPAIAGKTGVLIVTMSLSGSQDRIKALLKLSGQNQTTNLTPKYKEVFLDKTSSLPLVFFDLDSEYTQAGVSLQIEIDPLNQITESNENNNRFPQTGARSPGFKTIPPLRVRIVPLKTQANSNPSFSQTQTEQFKTYLQAIYPLSEVLVTVRSTPSTIYPMVLSDTQGTTWSSGLETFDAFRVAETSNSEKNIFYYGFFKHGSDSQFEQSSGGLAGLGYVSSNPITTQNPAPLSSIGLAFTTDHITATAAHEIGHNHGRNHVNNQHETNDTCSVPSSPDTNYPYNSSGANFGRIGKNGFNILTRTLYLADRYHDMMSYCNRVWISDYNYRAIHDFQNTLYAVFASSSVQPSVQALNSGQQKVIRISGSLNSHTANINHMFFLDGNKEQITQSSVFLEWTDQNNQIKNYPLNLLHLNHLAGSSFRGLIPEQESPARIRILKTDNNQVLFDQKADMQGILDILDQQVAARISENRYSLPSCRAESRLVRILTRDEPVLDMSKNPAALEFTGQSGEMVEIQIQDGINLAKKTILLP